MNKATIEKLAYTMRHHGENHTLSPLVSIKPQGTRPPFFCIHPAGGNVLCYRNLARYIDPEQPFYALQPTNLEGEGDPYPPVREMAAQYIEAMRTVQPHGPYYVGGWSFGGVVAFEIAHQLRRAGHKIGLLLLMDTVAPMPFTYFDDPVMIANVIRELGYPHGKQIVISLRTLRKLPAEEQLKLGFAVMKENGLVTDDMGIQWLKRLAEAYRCSVDITEAYHPELYPEEVTLFRATDLANADIKYLQEVFNMPPIPPVVMRVMMAVMKPIAKWLVHLGKSNDNLNWLADETLGWHKFTTQPVKIQKVKGDHLTLVAEPNVKILANALDAHLQKAQGFMSKQPIADASRWNTEHTVLEASR